MRWRKITNRWIEIITRSTRSPREGGIEKEIQNLAYDRSSSADNKKRSRRGMGVVWKEEGVRPARKLTARNRGETWRRSWHRRSNTASSTTGRRCSNGIKPSRR
ncbi:hypothetical protein COCNU_07G005820 [Cocos nucifera]|uniref:Uncharacterized protein n=1 Tax=Cocos nucifera TaxID=13894 RepID=A0A8K0N490_COCNU|nr:hypothetical protein COCNU_07G005820 [Cocos nucifera]